jgi:GDP-mannose 4,6 dehydratase
MWMIVQQSEADDYVIATWESRSVREFVKVVFAKVGREITGVGKEVEEKGVERWFRRILVEVDPRYFRRHVHVGRVEELFHDLPVYDLVLMVDVIEHIDKAPASLVLNSFLARGSTVLVATPRYFFQQELYESPDERHVSFWTLRDFYGPDRTIFHQNVGPSAIYVLKEGRMNRIPGFGNDPLTRVRRLARLTLSEFGLR